MTKREIIARAKAGFEKARRESPGVLFAKLIAYGTIDQDGNVISKDTTTKIPNVPSADDIVDRA